MLSRRQLLTNSLALTAGLSISNSSAKVNLEYDDPSEKDLASYEILRIYEFGIVDSWAWVGTLSVAASGKYTLQLEQELYTSGEGPEPFSGSLDNISEGIEIFEFIERVWLEDRCEGFDVKEWPKIIQSLRGIDEKLALSLAITLHEEYGEPSMASFIDQRALGE